MIFADGENLLLRYEAMLAKGRRPRPAPQIQYAKERFVWSRYLTQRASDLQFARVTYYTTHVGDEASFQDLRCDISKVAWSAATPPHGGFLVPRVFKKAAKARKTASVDINITIDMLRHCYGKDVGAVYLLTGDGDYLPLIEEAMRTGTRVFVGAFSEGLHPPLCFSADEFYDLDEMFFAD